MSKKSVSRVSAGLLKSVSVFALGAIVTGCAPGTVRFSDGFYTGAVPQQNVGATQTPFPEAQAQQTYQEPVYQTQAPAYDPQDTYSNDIDQTYTASVPAKPQTVRRQLLPQPKAQGAKRWSFEDRTKSVTPKSSLASSLPRTTPIKVTDPIQTASVSPSAAAKPVTVNQQPLPPARSQTTAREGWTAVGGTYVTMREGETVYNLAKRYGVPANAIMEANSLLDPKSVASGSRIIIPTYVYSRTAPVSAPDASAAVRSASSNIGSRSHFGMDRAPIPGTRPFGVQVASAAPTVLTVAAKSVDTNNSIKTGRYKVSSGDTLSSIARRSGTSVSAIKRLNGLTSDNVRIGQTLLVPGVDGNPSSATIVSAPATSESVTTHNKAVVKNNGSIATIDQSSTASAPAQTGVSTMRWPVKGRVVSGFGSNIGGKGNDGIDISVPRGTAVKAAENGVVIYAGDGLKEFGKTVLVRHGSGLVTVYGHLNDINVSRGANVKRGQSVGTSGMTGSAKQPQLHFEVRKNTSPVDPMTYLR